MKPSSANSESNLKLYMGQSYEIFLNKAIENLFQSHIEEDANLADFIDQFHELMQVRVDPPLEAIWVYCALTFHSSHLSGKDFAGQISLVKAQLQVISACSAACGTSKSIALLAPLCLWINGLFVFLFSMGFDSRTENKKVREVRSLVDLILGYIGVCCCRNSSNGDDSGVLIRPLEDLLALWMMDKRSGDVLLACSFPSLTSENRLRISKVGCDVGELAGAVAAELFLMRMGMSHQIENESTERSVLEAELKRWAVASLTGFKNVDLFEILLQILLEPEPLTSTLNSDSGDIIRKVLYDVMLVDYPFLDLESANHLSSARLKNIALMRLIVAFEAVELFRQEGDQSKAISYTDAFSTSRLRSQIVKLIPSGIGLSKSARTGSSPKAFIKWILDLEQQGFRVFDESVGKYTHKLSLRLSRAAHDQRVGEQSEGKDVDANDMMLCIDKVGERDTDTENEQELNTMSNAFVAAACAMNASETNNARKRKRGSSDKRKKQQTRPLVDNDPSDSSDTASEGDEKHNGGGSDAESESSDDSDSDKSDK